MAAGTVAGVYAQALLELAQEQGRRDAVVESCRGLLDTRVPALTPALVAQLDDPHLGKAKAKQVLDAALAGKVEPEVLTLLKLLVDRDRLADANAIFREAVAIADRDAGRIRVLAVTAVPLSSGARERLLASVRAAVGPNAALEERVEPGLIGGMTLRIGDTFVDGSVRRRYADLKSRILDARLPAGLWSA